MESTISLPSHLNFMGFLIQAKDHSSTWALKCHTWVLFGVLLRASLGTPTLYQNLSYYGLSDYWCLVGACFCSVSPVSS